MSDPDSIARLLKSSAEFRLIVDLVRSVPQRPDEALLRTIDWSRVLRLSQRHGITSMVYAQICQFGLVVPSEIADSFVTLYRERTARFLAQGFETVRVAAALRASGTDCLVLKGVAIANLLYSSNPAARQSTDIDIFVRPESVSAADQVLQQEGYERLLPNFDVPKEAREVVCQLLHAFEYVHRRDGYKLELHHRLTANPHAMRSNFASLWEAALTIETNAGPVKCLEEKATLIFLCCHSAAHAFSMLKWLCDLERAFDYIGLDKIPAIRNAAGSQFATNALNLAGQLVDEVFGTRVCGRLGIQPKRSAETYVVSQLMSENLPGGQRTWISTFGELRLAFFLQQMGETFAFRINEFVRMTCDVRDTQIVRRGRRWLFAYLLLGPLTALIRWLRRRQTVPGVFWN